jgi:hypothetical protein
VLAPCLFQRKISLRHPRGKGGFTPENCRVNDNSGQLHLRTGTSRAGRSRKNGGSHNFS